MTLTYKLDLDILPQYLHAKIPVCMSIRLGGRVRQTLRQTENVKTITPHVSEGVKKGGEAFKKLYIEVHT